MTVRRFNETQYKVTCDDEGCQNHFVFGVSQDAVKQAADWLERHGWRTIEGTLHWCSYCSNKLECFQGEGTDELERRLQAGRTRRYEKI